MLVAWFAVLIALDAFTPVRLAGTILPTSAPADPTTWRSWWAVVGMSALVLPTSVLFWGVLLWVWARITGARRGRFAVAFSAAIHATAVEVAGLTLVALVGLAPAAGVGRAVVGLELVVIAAYGIAVALACLRSLGMARAPAYAFVALVVLVQSMDTLL